VIILRHPAARAALIFIALVVLFNVVALSFGGNQPGPPSSSYSTDPSGAAAYAELLGRTGYRLERLRAPLGDAPLDSASTLVLLDAAPPSIDAEVDLERFVEDGGRLIVGGAAGHWVSRLFEKPPRRAEGGPSTLRPLLPVAETNEVAEVVAGGAGRFSDAGAGVPILGDDNVSSVVVATIGEGRVVLLADASIVHNEWLDHADNARFALNLAGDPERTVIFIESVHGYTSTGLSAIPSSWKWTLCGLVIAALVLMWARGRRLGPPEETGRDLPPARLLYVQAVAGTLKRTRNSAGAVQPLQERLRSRLAAHLGLGETPSEEDLLAGASERGLMADEARALFGSASTEQEVLALGRAAQKLAGTARGQTARRVTSQGGSK
jgi:hypothetical protein